MGCVLKHLQTLASKFTCLRVIFPTKNAGFNKPMFPPHDQACWINSESRLQGLPINGGTIYPFAGFIYVVKQQICFSEFCGVVRIGPQHPAGCRLLDSNLYLSKLT